MAEAKENVPEGVEIAMGPIATVMGEIYQYTLEGEDAERFTSKISIFNKLKNNSRMD